MNKSDPFGHGPGLVQRRGTGMAGMTEQDF